MATIQKEVFWQLILDSRPHPIFVRTSIVENIINGQLDQILLIMIDGLLIFKASSKVLVLVLSYNGNKRNYFLVDKKKLRDLASDVGEMDYGGFIAFTIKALTGQRSNAIYQLLDGSNNTKQLFWSRKIPNTEISVSKNSIFFFYRFLCIFKNIF